MTATIIDGKEFAATMRQKIALEAAVLKADFGVTPGLAVMIAGENPASKAYIASKKKIANELGFHSTDIHLPATVSEADLLRRVEELNKDPKIHGILVQLPLPAPLREDAVLNRIDPQKDVDGFGDINAGKLAKGKRDGFIPCTPLGCLMLLQHHLGNLSGKNAVVIGRSNIVGKPMAALLENENCTVAKVHSKTDEETKLRLCRNADILVVAMGKPQFVRGDWIKPGATVIDVGINRVGEKLVGDVHFSEASAVAGAITPVPGGVGPMTIACLMHNTLEAACRIHKIDRAALLQVKKAG